MIIQPDGGYTTAEGWTGISGRTYPQYSHPVSMTTKLEHSCNNQQFPGIHGFSSTGISCMQEKCEQEIS